MGDVPSTTPASAPDVGPDYSVPSGAADLVDRRAVLLSTARPGSPEDAELSAVTRRLGRILAVGEPVVRRVTSEDPPGLAERLASAEPVHPVAGPLDLADRLDVDRRCYVIEHPGLPDRPLNVVWVALVRGVAGDLADILDPSAPAGDPAAADTAVFYSIWSIESGLSGLGRGEELIVGATELLGAELSNLSTFVTLSPVAGFRRWVEQGSRGAHAREDLTDVVDRLERAGTGDGPWSGERGSPAERTGRRRHDPETDKDDARLADDLMRLCAEYLTTLHEGWRPIDPVARFHLGNGARLFGLNWRGDVSERGLERSWGIMANYRYAPEDRDANQSQLGSGSVPVSEEVAALLDADGD